MKKEGAKGMKSFTEWIKHNAEEDNICPPSLPAQRAVDFLCNYLLGEDWYCVMPIHTEQVNTEKVHQILMKYSRKYRKEYKKAIRELVR